MKILIIGVGKVGFRLAASLSDEDNNVTVMDTDRNALQRASDNLDVMCVAGNGVSVTALIEAGVRNCDLLIAVTESDEVNMICCLMGKKMGARHTVARIRELYYHEEVGILKEEMELDMVINPEAATAREISRKLEYRWAVLVDTFAGGGADLVETRVYSDCPLNGRAIMEASAGLMDGCLVAAVLRGRQVIVPNGMFVIQEGDLLYIIGQRKNIIEFSKKIGAYSEGKVKNAIIVGGGRIALYLADIVKESGIKVKVVEIDRDKAEDLAGKLSNGMVITGDGTDEDLLFSENLEDADALVAITGHDEDNLMSSLIASEHKVPKVITKMTRSNYIPIVKKLGINNVVNPMIITANLILKFARALNARNANIVALYKIIDDSAEVIEYEIDKNCKFINKPLKELTIPSGVLVTVIRRKGKIIIPKGDTAIEVGDHIIIFTTQPLNRDLNKVITQGGRYGFENNS